MICCSNRNAHSSITSRSVGATGHSHRGGVRRNAPQHSAGELSGGHAQGQAHHVGTAAACENTSKRSRPSPDASAPCNATPCIRPLAPRRRKPDATLASPSREAVAVLPPAYRGRPSFQGTQARPRHPSRPSSAQRTHRGTHLRELPGLCLASHLESPAQEERQRTDAQSGVGEVRRNADAGRQPADHRWARDHPFAPHSP